MQGLRVIMISVAVLAAAAVETAAAELTPRQIYENAAPGVVVVVGTEEQGKGSTGTGAIIDPQGLVFTNAHVVVDKETGKPFAQLLVILKPDRVTGRPDKDYARRFKARVVAINRELDLAALRFDPGSSKPRVLPISNPDRLQIGDWVAAIGHPEQGGLWTYTTGVVSAEFEDFQNTKGKDVFQTEISMNRGNSGGPLLDANGHVVGVNTSIARLAPDGLPITSISFSVKSSVLQEWLAGQGIRVAYSEPPRPSPAAQPALSQVQAPPTSAEPPSVAQAPVASPAPPAPEPPAPASTTPSAPPAAVSTPPPSPAPQPVSPKIVEPPAAVQALASDKPARAKPAKPAEDSKPFKTKARPYDPDRLVDDIRRLDTEMEDLAEEMRKKFRPR